MIQPDYRLRVIGYEYIHPYDPNLINPASIDLRLGNIIRQPHWFWRNPVTRQFAWLLSSQDPKATPDQFWGKPVEFETFTLWPGQFVLCHSLEVVEIPLDHVGILYSKSSTGRLGLEHLHAGYADPGFCGQLTFEFSNMAPWPVRLTAGQPLMQIVFEQLNGRPDKSYGVTGRYQGQAGPTAARQEKIFYHQWFLTFSERLFCEVIMIAGMLWQCSGELDQQVEQAVAFAKSKYNKKAQRVDVSETAVKAETTIAGVVVRPSRLIQPGTLFLIWEGCMNLNPNAPRRPALRYYGGGWTRAPWTISFIPEHDNYLEPCFGAGSILLRKPVARNEVVNDADGRTINFFRVLREQPQALLNLINLTPWAEDEMRSCIPISPDPLEDARRFFLICWATVYGGPTGQYYSFRYQKLIDNRFTAPPHDAINREDLLVTADRLKNVTIMNRDALELIKKFIREYAVIYFDPPYLAEKRRRKQGYNHEPSRAWHIEAAQLLRQSNGPVLVAGYRSKLYAELYEEHGFVRMERVQQTNGKTKAVECLWLSPITLAWLERDEENKRKQAAALAEERRQSMPLLAGIWEEA